MTHILLYFPIILTLVLPIIKVGMKTNLCLTTPLRHSRQPEARWTVVITYNKFVALFIFVHYLFASLLSKYGWWCGGWIQGAQWVVSGLSGHSWAPGRQGDVSLSWARSGIYTLHSTHVLQVALCSHISSSHHTHETGLWPPSPRCVNL